MKKRWQYLLIVSLLIFLLASCNLPTGQPEVPLPTNTVAPSNTPEPSPTADPYANIPHSDLPGEPILTYWAYDCDTGKYTTAADKPNIGGGCDQWALNYIERPVNQEMNLYYPNLDIVRFQMGKDDAWLYADIQTSSNEGMTTELNGSYGLELDFNSNGQGEILVMVDNPSGFEAGEWHTLGVQVWEDSNDDIGGETLVYADEENPGDGYETQLFDQGLGDDPDFAWARISPDDPATVEFAIKRSIIPNGVGAFLWWTWASQQPLNPGSFDYVDTYGDQELYQIGNLCRWVFDGPPQPVPNICFYEAPTPEPGENYCWVRSNSVIAVFPATCQVCPNPCPDGYSCYGSCVP